MLFENLFMLIFVWCNYQGFQSESEYRLSSLIDPKFLKNVGGFIVLVSGLLSSTITITDRLSRQNAMVEAKKALQKVESELLKKDEELSIVNNVYENKFIKFKSSIQLNRENVKSLLYLILNL